MINFASSLFSPVLNAVSAGKTVLLFRFSLINPAYQDIHLILPTINEAETLNSLKILHGDIWLHEIELAFIDKFCPIYIEKAWLLSDAPAGLASSLFKTSLQLAYPGTVASVQALISVARQTFDNSIFDQLKQQAILGGNTHSQLDKMDAYNLIKQVLIVEPKLIAAGILGENGLEIIDKAEIAAREQKKFKKVPKTEILDALGGGRPPR